MTKEVFTGRVRELLPHPAEAALGTYISYAEELDADGTVKDHEFYDELYAALCLAAQRYGAETASALFDYGEHFTFNPFEIPGAARLLSEGKTLNEAMEHALNVGLDYTPEEWDASKAMLERLKAEDPNRPGMDLSV